MEPPHPSPDGTRRSSLLGWTEAERTDHPNYREDRGLDREGR